jgi:Zn-dependent protease
LDSFDDRSSRPAPPVIELLPPGYAPVEAILPPPPRPRWRLALLLLALTFFTTTTLGPAFWAFTRTDFTTDLFPLLSPSLVSRVWGDPDLLKLGLSFSIPLLTILLAHEMGHYLACRYYRLPATLPYFLPLPSMLGTLGAFIRIKTPLRNRRELFDVGIAGPLAGFVALIPFLLYGVAHSQPGIRPTELRLGETIALPGRSLALDLVARIFHGPIGSNMVLNLHPYALAAWFGLLATSINLIPLGQLDGGHILYAVSRRWQRRLALPVWAGLAAAGFLWPGWWLWCVLTLVFRVFHPPVQNERAPLGRGRKILAAVALAILVLSFMPRGIVVLEAVPADGPAEQEGGTWVKLLQKSATSVTGPSLTSATSMVARKRPVSTLKPRPRRSSTKASMSGAASSGGAARSNDGLRPRSTEPASVNWETTRKEPPAEAISAISRFILPASSSNTRRPASFAAAART